MKIHERAINKARRLYSSVSVGSSFGIPFVVPGVSLVDRATLLLVVVFWQSSGLVKVDSGVVQVSPMLVAVLSLVVEQ